MSYLTKNEPNPELVDIFAKLSKAELDTLANECKRGNYGILSTAIGAARLHVSQATKGWYELV